MSATIPTGTELRRAAMKRIEGYVCKDRQATHGDAEDNFRQIAEYWSLYKGTKFTPLDVAAMMALVKVARMATSPNHIDNWDDLAGYAVCGAGIVEATRLREGALRYDEPAATPNQRWQCAKCEQIFGPEIASRDSALDGTLKHYCLDCYSL